MTQYIRLNLTKITSLGLVFTMLTAAACTKADDDNALEKARKEAKEKEENEKEGRKEKGTLEKERKKGKKKEDTGKETIK